ncbi:MAG: hypothetical protein CMM47_01105 [Rhodospirillaceae bacterium]|nr:hypothetical protein [Rhodospirillaceae bacterium]
MALIAGRGDVSNTQAAIAAGYSPTSARTVPQETLRNPAVQASMEHAQTHQFVTQNKKTGT